MVLHIDNNLFNDCKVQFQLKVAVEKKVDLSNLSYEELQKEFIMIRNAAFDYIKTNNGNLPSIAFPEEHPYPPISNHHWSTYIIGTNPPVNYLCDLAELQIPLFLPNGKKLDRPSIPFYHGNKNSLWDHLDSDLIPEKIQDRNIVATQIKTWLENNNINYLDIIKQCQRKTKYEKKKKRYKHYSSSDECYRNILPNLSEIIKLLNTDVSDVLILANTSSTFYNGLKFFKNGSINNSKNNAFDMLIEVSQKLNYHISFALKNEVWIDLLSKNASKISDAFKNKVIFYIKINNKKFIAVAGPSPSNANSRRRKEPECFLLYCNKIYGGYNELQKDNYWCEFKKYIYKNAIKHNYNDLWELNV